MSEKIIFPLDKPAEKKFGDAGKYIILWTCGDDCNCHQLYYRVYTDSGLVKEEELGGWYCDPENEEWEDMRQAFVKCVKENKPDFIDCSFPAWVEEKYPLEKV